MQRKQARLQYLTLPTTKNLQSYNNYVNSQYATKGDKTRRAAKKIKVENNLFISPINHEGAILC